MTEFSKFRNPRQGLFLDILGKGFGSSGLAR